MQVAFGRVRRKTEPTGPGENIELPIYFLKLHKKIRILTAKQTDNQYSDDADSWTNRCNG